MDDLGDVSEEYEATTARELPFSAPPYAKVWDGTGRDGTGRDGTGRDGTGRDGTGHDACSCAFLHSMNICGG